MRRIVTRHFIATVAGLAALWLTAASAATTLTKEPPP
jgi:hypothetical protein